MSDEMIGADGATNGPEHRFLQNNKKIREMAAELREESACECEDLDLLESEAQADEDILFFGYKKRQVIALEQIAKVLQTFLDMVNEGMINKITK